MLCVFLLKIKSTYISPYFAHSFDRPLPYRQVLRSRCLPVTCNVAVSQIYHVRGPEMQRRPARRTPYSAGLRVRPTDGCHHPDTSGGYILPPYVKSSVYNPPSPLPLKRLVLPPNIFHSLLFPSESKASKNVFGVSRQTSPVYST